MTRPHDEAGMAIDEGGIDGKYEFSLLDPDDDEEDGAGDALHGPWPGTTTGLGGSPGVEATAAGRSGMAGEGKGDDENERRTPSRSRGSDPLDATDDEHESSFFCFCLRARS